jgi:hypothetical protein
MQRRTEFAKAITYFLGLIVFIVVVFNEEFYDGTRRRFWDMTATLQKWPDCFDKWGLQTFESGERNIKAQGECSRFNYGIFTIPLYRLMAIMSQNESLWTCVLFAIFVLLLMVVAPRKFNIHILSLLVLISPPVSLLFESGNPDLLNIVLCMLAGVALYQRWVVALALSSSVVALHKFYGVAIWITIAFLFYKEKSPKRIISTGIIMISIVVLSYQVLHIGLYDFIDAGANHYGITIWDNYFRKVGLDFNEIGVQIVGIATLVLFSGLVFWKKSREFAEEGSLSRPTSVAVVLYLVFIFSYVTTSNVDYRLTFLGVAVIMDCQHYLSRSLFSRLMLILSIASLYISYPMGYRELIPGLSLQAIGDVVLHFVVAYCLARSWALFSSLRKSLIEPQVSMG